MFAASGEIASRRWPGAEPFVVLVHATGFCKETWEPFAAALTDTGADRALLAVDQRGHGDSFVPDPPFDWWDLGRDVLAVAGRGPSPLGVGHSSGAAALVMAELIAPGTFEALLLIEPIIFPPPHRRREDNPMTAQALRRRAAFASREEAVANFRGRGPFALWTDDALAAYVRGGLRREADGWVLKCRPEVEAEFYRAGTAHGVWERMGEVACPVQIVGGELSTTHPAEFVSAQSDRFPNATAVMLPGASHFVPMEQPTAVAGLAAAMLSARAA